MDITNLDQETQDYINQLLQAEGQKVADVQAELEALQQSQKSKDDELQQLKDQLFEQRVEQTLKDADLLQFKDVINVNTDEELNAVIEKLSNAVSSTQQDFTPSGKRQTTAYDNAQAKGDTVGMISAKLGKLFK